MSYGQVELDGLLNDASITALLSDPDYIYYDNVAPSAESGGPGAEESYINYYRVVPVDARLNYMQSGFSVNCRGASMAEVEAISRAVVDVVNRHSNDSVNFGCQVLATIPPSSPVDNYNSPVEVTAKGRSI